MLSQRASHCFAGPTMRVQHCHAAIPFLPTRCLRLRARSARYNPVRWSEPLHLQQHSLDSVTHKQHHCARAVALTRKTHIGGATTPAQSPAYSLDPPLRKLHVKK